MLDLTTTNIGLMLLASAGAGLVDAIVGGGGLIIVPSLFALFPQAVPATLLGTNRPAAAESISTDCASNSVPPSRSS